MAGLRFGNTPAASVPIATPISEPTRAERDWESLTPEEQAAIFEREGPIGTAINEVLTAFPDDYAYGYISDEGFGVGFKFDAPAEALPILDAVGDPYELHENVGFTEADAQSQVARALDLIEEVVGKPSLTAYANVYTVTVEVEFYPDSDGNTDPVALDGAAIERLEESIRPELYPGFDVKITSVPGVSIGF